LSHACALPPTCDEQPALTQQAVGRRGGGRADAEVARDGAHRGQEHARREDAVADASFETGGDLGGAVAGDSAKLI
jgi:hypothetical protein